MPKTALNQPLLFISKYSLFILTFIFVSVCYAIWQHWPELILSSMRWQRGIYEQLSELLYNAKEHIVTVSISLAGLSFLYGALHSLGPGHGKLIVTTYLATHPTKVKMSLVLTILSALLQAVVAIVLVSTLLLVFNSSMREVNDNANYFITLSFYVVILLGVLIVWRNLRSTWSLFFSKPEVNNQPEHIQHSHHDHSHDQPHDHSHDHSHHQHSEDCGCGHKHFVEADLINQASSFKEYLVIILSIGVRPCTGAVMVLLFANMAGIYWLGVVSAFVMAIGTALTTSIIAIMTITGKQIIKRYLTNNHRHSSTENTSKSALMGICCRLSGGILLILVGFLLISSQPIGMSPIL